MLNQLIFPFCIKQMVKLLLHFLQFNLQKSPEYSFQHWLWWLVIINIIFFSTIFYKLIYGKTDFWDLYWYSLYYLINMSCSHKNYKYMFFLSRHLILTTGWFRMNATQTIWYIFYVLGFRQMDGFQVSAIAIQCHQDPDIPKKKLSKAFWG